MNTAHFNVFSQKLGVDLDGITHHYSFENNILLSDKIGNTDGNVTGLPAMITGRVGNSFNFDGINDSVNFNNNLGMTAFPFSVKFWYKSPNTLFNRIITGESYTLYDGIILSVGNGKVYVEYGNGTKTSTGRRSYSTDSAPIMSGQWNQVHVNFVSFFEIEIYVNGLLESSSYLSGTASTESLITPVYSIAFDKNSTHYSYNIDELTIFDKKVEGSQIIEIYNQENNGNSII